MNASKILATACLMFASCSFTLGDELAIDKPLIAFQGVGLDGKTVSSATLLEKNPLVVIVMRGFPGYNCPACSAQLADFIKEAEAIKTAGAQVAIIYPGSVEDLEAKAKGFVGKQQLADAFHLVIDKDMKIVKQLGLFWDAPKETAYPTTLVADRQGNIRFLKISRSHGGRVKASEVIDAIKKLH